MAGTIRLPYQPKVITYILVSGQLSKLTYKSYLRTFTTNRRQQSLKYRYILLQGRISLNNTLNHKSYTSVTINRWKYTLDSLCGHRKGRFEMALCLIAHSTLISCLLTRSHRIYLCVCVYVCVHVCVYVHVCVCVCVCLCTSAHACKQSI